MAYPSLEQYQEALQHPATALTDSELKTGQLALNGLGLPLVLCGGSALTYRISLDSRCYALRCFHRPSPSLQERYTAITARLREIQSPYFVGFEFQPEGVRIDRQFFPAVKMAWAAGETLGAFLDRRHADRLAIRNLLHSLRQLAHFFEDAGIAHGDLQPGNITVSGHGRTLQLIDYDGLYVEALGELGSPELGHRNFQHPQRGHVQPFGRGLDRFSLISLTVALMALSHDPSLWESSGSDMEAILFRAQDFADPLRSSLFSTLAGVPVIAREARQLAAICQSSIHAIPSLEDFLNGHNLPGPLPEFPPAHRSSLRPAYLPGYPVLDASRFAECLPFVGEKVEIVGRITRLHRSRTRWGDEYLFLNFGHWEKNIVKINLWNEGLRVLRNPPNESWEGRYVSAIGLMEPPWSSPQHRYQHLAITVTQGGQLHQISEQEARERLAGPRPGGQRVQSPARPVPQTPPPGPSMTPASPAWYLDPAPPAPLRPPKRRSRLVTRLLSWLR